MFWLDLKEITNSSNSFTAVVHKSSRENYFDILPSNANAAALTEKFAFTTQSSTIAIAEMMEENYARIVTIGIMLWAWITQTHYEF